MRKLAVALAATAVVTAAGGRSASPAAVADPCGLPDSKPMWIDYAEGSVAFRDEVFGRPGVVAATSGVAIAAALRERGAETVNWWMKLGRLVGTTLAPAEAATVPAAAGDVVTKAVAATGCESPVIVFNELSGAGATTPWTSSTAGYRANVLSLLRAVAERGGRPIILVSARPYTDGDAADWWRQVAGVALIAREVYFPAPKIMRSGVVLGSRSMRRSYRQAVADFTSVGIAPDRLGLVIGFQSGPGKGGREGLQPTQTWLRFVKLQTLAAAEVAGETRIATVVSWGWGTFDRAGADADKPKAACVYLWSRNASLCDGPAAAGDGFVDSLAEGQLILQPGVRCTVDGRAVTTREISALATLTGDRDVALTALFARAVDSAHASASPRAVVAAERAMVDAEFGGRRAAYLAALRASHASVLVARAIIADQLRRQQISRRLSVPEPTAAQTADFYALYPDVAVRPVRASRPASWLGGRESGLALVPPGPRQLLELRTRTPATVLTSEGPLTVTPLEETLPLGAIPLAAARPAIRAALVAYARAGAFGGWTITAQTRAQNRAVCRADALPQVAAVDLTSYLPFLSLEA